MQDAFIDNSVVREEVIHKIVEVKVWDDKAKNDRKEKKPKREKSSKSPKKEKKKSKSSDSESSNMGVDQEEYK